LTFPSL